MGLPTRFVISFVVLLHVKCSMQLQADFVSAKVINQATRNEFVKQFNLLRAPIDGATAMECVKWNSALANSAAAYANTCNFARQPSTSLQNIAGYNQVGQTIAANVPTDFPAPGDVLFEWLIIGLTSYNVNTNVCSDTQANCLNYKTMTYAKNNEVGCAAALCSKIQNYPDARSGYIYVCHYGARATPYTLADNNLVNIAPYEQGTVCSQCNTAPIGKQLCCNELCCDGTVLNQCTVVVTTMTSTAAVTIRPSAVGCTPISTLSKGVCTNQIGDSKCNAVKTMGLCDRMPSYYWSCYKTCANCQPVCKNFNDNRCASYKSTGRCSSSYKRCFQDSCPLASGYCCSTGTVSGGGSGTITNVGGNGGSIGGSSSNNGLCIDTITNCSRFAVIPNACNKYRSMKTACKKYCGFC